MNQIHQESVAEEIKIMQQWEVAGTKKKKGGSGFPKYMQHKFKAVWTVLFGHSAGLITPLHVRRRICLQLPVRATKRVSVEPDPFFFPFFWRIYSDTGGDKRCVCNVCL